MSKVAYVVGAASATLTLPEEAVKINSAFLVPGGSAANSAYTIKTTTPSSGDLQFTGTPQAPSKTATAGASVPATSVVLVTYDPVGELPTNE